MFDVRVAEGHPKPDPLQTRDVLDEGLELLVVQQVGLTHADLGKVEVHALRHGLDLLPLTALPVLPLLGDLPDVDLRIEVGRECVSVITTIAVEDVDGLDAVQQVVAGVCAEDVGDPGVEPGAHQRHQARLLEPLSVGPLPLVFELRLVPRFVVGGVHVVDAGLEACVHDREILVGQGHVDDQRGAELLDERDGLRNVVGIHRRRRDVTSGQLFDRCRDRVATALGTACEQDLAEDVRVLGTLVGNDTADATRSDDEDLVHGESAAG